MKSTHYYITFLFLLLSTFIFGQREYSCGADLLNQKKLNENSSLKQKRDSMNLKIREHMYSSRPKRRSVVENTIYTIPVVVHVVHRANVAIGDDENLSVAQIEEGIEDLNQAFRNIAPFNPNIGADIQIEFCLAKQDPDGNASTGIVRYENNTFADLNINTEDDGLKTIAAPQWDPYSYCNIWLVNEICSDNAGNICGTAGYAFLAPNHGTYYDGIVNEAFYFGFNEHGSKVHIHEMGHYLNLEHTFHGGCNNNDCTSEGDFVCDTPPDNDTDDNNCITGGTHNSCTTDEDDTSTNNPFRAVSLGGIGDQPDMMENYMDYSQLNCQEAFTTGQKNRMRASLELYRSSLLSSQGCIDPASTVIYFDKNSISLSEKGTTDDNDCRSFVDYAVPVLISNPPTGNADVTISYSGSAIADSIDYEIITDSISFLDGDDSPQDILLRIWDDIATETDETIEIQLTLSNNNSDATISIDKGLFTLEILDDEGTPTNQRTYFLNEDFESTNYADLPTGWDLSFFSGESDDVFWLNGPDGIGNNSVYITTFDRFPERKDSAELERSYVLLTPSLDLSTVNNTTYLEFDIDMGGSPDDYLDILYSDGTPFDFLVGDLYNLSETKRIELPSSLLGESSVRLGFTWNSDGDGLIQGDVPALDNIRIYSVGDTAQSATNITSLESYFGPNQTVHILNDDNTIVASVTNLENWDYGCTTFEIDRSGTGAQAFQSNSQTDYAFDKTFLITPTNNKSDGQYEITFYYTEAEVVGWEQSTLNDRADISLFKSSSSIDSEADDGIFGSNQGQAITSDGISLTATFETGFSGFGASSNMSVLPISYNSENISFSQRAFNIEASPNPFNDMIELKGYSSKDGLILISVSEISGGMVFTSNLAQRTKGNILETISLPNNLKAGVYFLEITHDNQKTIRKLIKL